MVALYVLPLLVLAVSKIGAHTRYGEIFPAANHGSPGSTTSPAGGLDCPLQGHIAVPPKGGLTNHVHYVTGSRLKAASLLPLFKALFPVGHSRTAQQYTSLSFLHSHFRLFRSNNLLPRNDDHTDLCTPDVCQKASGYFSP